MKFPLILSYLLLLSEYQIHCQPTTDDNGTRKIEKRQSINDYLERMVDDLRLSSQTLRELNDRESASQANQEPPKQENTIESPKKPVNPIITPDTSKQPNNDITPDSSKQPNNDITPDTSKQPNNDITANNSTVPNTSAEPNNSTASNKVSAARQRLAQQLQNLAERLKNLGEKVLNRGRNEE